MTVVPDAGVVPGLVGYCRLGYVSCWNTSEKREEHAGQLDCDGPGLAQVIYRNPLSDETFGRRLTSSNHSKIG